MILYFAFPCLITLRLGTMKISSDLVFDFVIVAVLGAASFVIFTLIAHGYYRLRGIKDKVSAPALLCSCMPNNGFIGYPVALIFLGNTGLILMIAHGAVVFNVYVFTYAINYIRSSKNEEKIPMTKRRVLQLFVQVMTNPNIIAIIIGLLIFALGLSLDNPAGEYLSMISSMASPLAMIYTGAILAGNKISAIFKDPFAWEGSFLKLILIPAVFFGLILPLPISDVAKAILILGVSFPSAVIPVMLGQQEGVDTHQASRLLFLSTFLSMATLPVVMFLLQKFLEI
jgi:predicted permease